MARTLTANAAAEVAKTHGTEPLTVLEIQWTEGGHKYVYADSLYNDSVSGLIAEMSEVDAVIQVSDNADSTQVSVTLDDVNGTLRDIINQNDIHHRPVWVYQTFSGLETVDRVLLFRGKINSPIVWSEGDRTLSFDVLTQIEGQEVGFSIEEGNFDLISGDIVGKPWPLAFGKVRNVPALLAKGGIRGYLMNGVAIADPTLLPRREQIERTCCPTVKIHTPAKIGGSIGNYTYVPPTDTYGPDPDCTCKNSVDADALRDQYNFQSAFERSTVRIVNGERFPQGQTVYLKIAEATLVGTFSGDVFTVQQRLHPALNTLQIPPIKRFDCPHRSEEPPNKYRKPTTGCIVTTGGGNAVTRSQESFNYLATFPTSSFFWAEAGTEVVGIASDEIVYIANLIPSRVLSVKAWQTSATGARRLVRVPDTYYTVRVVDYGGYSVTEIVMDVGLLSLRGEGWSDDVYVTMESDVGPNPVDVLEWVIDRYTELSVDTTSFEAMRLKLTGWPTNFALLERKNVTDFLREFAYQLRCAVFVRNDTVYLKFLPSLEDSLETFAQEDIIANTLRMTHTNTEDIVTKYVSLWTDDYSRSSPYTYSFLLHTKRYGVRKEEFDYWALTNRELIQVSSKFWLIRKSQTWRLLEFNTTLSHIGSDVFDTVSINLPDFSSEVIGGCMVQESRIDTNSREVSFKIWTPVLAGSQTVVSAAYPADLTEYLDLGSLGPGDETVPNTDVTPPQGTYLAPDLGPELSLSLGNTDPCSDPESFSSMTGMCPEPPEDEEKEDPVDDLEEDQPDGGSWGGSPTGGSPEIQTNEFVEEDVARGEEGAFREHLTSDVADATAPSENPVQDAFDSLPDPDDIEGCVAKVVAHWYSAKLIQRPDFGCTSDPSASGPVCVADHLGDETLGFNSLEAAKAVVEGSPNMIEPPKSVGEVFAIYQSAWGPTWGPECEEPAEEIGAGIIGYSSEGGGYGMSAEHGVQSRG